MQSFEDGIDVDLSPFKGFPTEELSLFVSRLRKRGKMTTSCLLNKPDFTIEDLRGVLRGAARLKALYTGGPSNSCAG